MSRSMGISPMSTTAVPPVTRKLALFFHGLSRVVFGATRYPHGTYPLFGLFQNWVCLAQKGGSRDAARRFRGMGILPMSSTAVPAVTWKLALFVQLTSNRRPRPFDRLRAGSERSRRMNADEPSTAFGRNQDVLAPSTPRAPRRPRQIPSIHQSSFTIHRSKVLSQLAIRPSVARRGATKTYIIPYGGPKIHNNTKIWLCCMDCKRWPCRD